MIDFSKFGFTVSEMDGKKCDDETATSYENELLEIQHWKKPNVYMVALRRERFIEWKHDYRSINEAIEQKKPNTGGYVIKEGISEPERKFAEQLLGSSFYAFPLYVGAITGETFFEILINSVCTDAEKLMQCGS
jgi:hypothetical protein